MSTVGQKVGYRYGNPDAPMAHGKSFDVLRVRSNDHKLEDTAYFFQKIMHDAFAEQYEDEFTADEIAETAYHRSSSLVDGQIKKLREAPDEGQPAYYRAQIMVPRVSQSGLPMMEQNIGLGKSKNAGRQGGLQLADISDVYVSPFYQSNGVGTAIAHSLLEGFPEDMTTVFYDFEFNARLKPLFRQLGFQVIKTWDAPYFGHQVPQTYYRGPLVGELTEILQKRSPWLKDRQPL